MKISTIVKVLLKAILIPIISVLVLNKFDLTDYFTFVPKEYRYEICLTICLAVIEALCEFLEKFIAAKRAEVTCVFSKSGNDKDIRNVPLLICESNMGVATIDCYIELKGNLKRLRKCKVQMVLPSWLTPQISAKDAVLKYLDDKLIWEFDKVLPREGNKDQYITLRNKISFIKNVDDNSMSIELDPQMKNVKGINFQTNKFKVKSGM